MAETTITIRIRHETQTDVAHIDICEPAPGTVVDVLEIGDRIGFPGMVIARVDREHGTLLGVTIHNYSAFRWHLIWHYRVASVRRALQLVVNSISAGMNNRHEDHHVYAH